MSSTPVMTTVGVVTLPTYMSGDCLSHCSGFSQNGASKKLYVKNGMSVWPAKLSQSITGHPTAVHPRRVHVALAHDRVHARHQVFVVDARVGVHDRVAERAAVARRPARV